VVGLLALSAVWPAAIARAAAPVAFETDRVEIVTHDGRRYDFTVEIARTPTQRARGLMYRREMAPDHGMLFDFGGIGPRAFWMKNTYLSLDILFLERDGRIWRIAADTTPLSEETITARGPIRAALELKAGTCRLLGIEVGDQVRHALFGNAASDARTE
jgi:uncharacterized membrane protein (UPF0127 family)